MVPFDLAAALAHWLRMRRMWRLPFGERWLLDTPAVSSSPGHAPTQDESCLAEGKVAAVAPTSAMICCAESTPRPGTSASRSTASCCRRSRFAISWLSLPICSSRSEEHTSELQSPCNLVCRLLLEKKKIKC